jgi:hypothetical protein
MTWIGSGGVKTENTSPANRKEEPQRGVPIIAQGKSAPSGRSPGFRSRDLASAECLLGVITQGWHRTAPLGRTRDCDQSKGTLTVGWNLGAIE